MKRMHALALTMCLWSSMAAADPVAEVTSPDGRIRVQLDINPEGRLAYRVDRDGKPVLEDSRLGFQFRNAEALLRNLKLVKQATREVEADWELPWGERREVRNHYRELRVSIEETVRAQRHFDVVFRVYDDGFGFRYEMPRQPHATRVEIEDDLSEFAVARPATAWWIPAGEWNRYEYLYQKTPLSEVSQAHTPITVRTDDGLHLSFHEAALVDYAAMWLRRVDGQRLRAHLAPGGKEGASVVRMTPFSSPWRTVQISDRAGGLVESSLILNLNEPNKLGDVSWFKPAKYVGVWWSLHLDTESWATGSKHGATTANTRRYIDFAAQNGIRGVLVEGWNPGWDGMWFGNGWDFDFTRPVADFDLPALTAYAKTQAVHLVGHHETGCAVSHYETQLDASMAYAAEYGIDVVKTGYVCDAGQIERQDSKGGDITREWHDGQWMSNHHLRVVQAAAKHHVAVNPHEPIKDTGLRRTYPNWVSREGARGMEYNAWGQPPNPPDHEINLVFTRLLSGPMDYTPGIVSLTGRGGQEIPSTLARQLALYVTLYSPIQMVADLPEHYAKQPEAMKFIRDVPVDWDDTRVLNGEVGEFVTIARKARASGTWAIRAMTDTQQRPVEFKLDFLTPGQRYRAEIYRDGEGADWRGDARFRFVREEKIVSADDTMAMTLAPGGGAAVLLVPLP